ncbi:hypothetical protein D3C73_1645440 [compost metagenome]
MPKVSLTWVMPTGIVIMFSEVTTRKGQKKAFHTVMKVTIAMAVVIPQFSGR